MGAPRPVKTPTVAIVIWESWPWREELCRVAQRLEARRSQKRWNERTTFLVERDLMVGAYAIRKLSEAKKLSTAFEAEQVPATEFPLKGSRHPDRMNWHRVDEFYDLDDGRSVDLTLRDVCNQFIHSWVFMEGFSDGGPGLDGVFVCSDSERKKRLLYFKVETLVRILRRAGEEEITSASMVRGNDGEWVVTEARASPSVLPHDLSELYAQGTAPSHSR